MPLFYFDYVENGKKRLPDDVGTELRGPHEALLEARHAMAEFAKDELGKAASKLELAIEVRDGNSRPTLRVSLHFEAANYQ